MSTATVNLYFLFLITRTDAADWETSFDVRPLKVPYSSLNECNRKGDRIYTQLKDGGRFPSLHGYVCMSVDEWIETMEAPRTRHE